jgi:hypothetical protein
MIIVFLTLVPVLTRGQDEEDITASFKDPRTAVICSALFPGAGQIYNRKWLKAGLMTGLEVYTLYRARSFHENYKNDTSDKESQINRNKHLWYAAGVYVYAMLDAFVDAHLSSFPEGSLVYIPSEKRMNLVLTLEF